MCIIVRQLVEAATSDKRRKHTSDAIQDTLSQSRSIQIELTFDHLRRTHLSRCLRRRWFFWPNPSAVGRFIGPVHAVYVAAKLCSWRVKQMLWSVLRLLAVHLHEKVFFRANSTLPLRRITLRSQLCVNCVRVANYICMQDTKSRPFCGQKKSPSNMYGKSLSVDIYALKATIQNAFTIFLTANSYWAVYKSVIKITITSFIIYAEFKSS